MTLTRNGKEHPLIIGTMDLNSIPNDHMKYIRKVLLAKNIWNMTFKDNELESYGYKFLRINKFTLSPKEEGQTELEVLNQLLYTKYRDILYQ